MTTAEKVALEAARRVAAGSPSGNELFAFQVAFAKLFVESQGPKPKKGK